MGARNGRSVVYGLFDSHVASLIDEALRHIDHVSAQGPHDDHEVQEATDERASDRVGPIRSSP